MYPAAFSARLADLSVKLSSKYFPIAARSSGCLLQYTPAHDRKLLKVRSRRPQTFCATGPLGGLCARFRRFRNCDQRSLVEILRAKLTLEKDETQLGH